MTPIRAEIVLPPMIGQGWASGARRHGEEEHRGRSHRGDDQGNVRPLSDDPAADEAGQRDAQESTEAGDEPLAQRRPRQDRPKQARSEQVAETTSRTGDVGHPLVLPPCDHPARPSPPPTQAHGSGIPVEVLQAASRFAISIGNLPAGEANRESDAERGPLSPWRSARFRPRSTLQTPKTVASITVM